MNSLREHGVLPCGRYPEFQAYHQHPYTLHEAALDGNIPYAIKMLTQSGPNAYHAKPGATLGLVSTHAALPPPPSPAALVGWGWLWGSEGQNVMKNHVIGGKIPELRIVYRWCARGRDSSQWVNRAI